MRDTSILRIVYEERLEDSVPLSVAHAPRLRDQQASGQCWLFAGVALLETLFGDALQDRYVDIVLLYKQFLKAHVTWSLNKLACVKEGRERDALLDMGINDGALWSTFEHLIKQHGVRTFPRARRELPFSAQNTADMLNLLSSQVRNGVDEAVLYQTIDGCLPDAQGDARIHNVNFGLQCVQLVDAPHLPRNRWYSNYFDLGGKDRIWNVDSVETLLQACDRMLNRKRGVWVSVCIDTEFDWNRLRAGGPRNGPLPLPPANSKEERCRQRDLSPGHALLLVGHKGNRWRLHNSWGKQPEEGYAKQLVVSSQEDEHDIVATTEWMEMHLFEAVVFSDVCSLPDGPVIPLEPWDILSTVARRRHRHQHKRA